MTKRSTQPKSKRHHTAVVTPQAPEKPKLQPEKTEVSKSEVFNMQTSTAFREVAEQTLTQAKEAYETVTKAAQQTAHAAGGAYSTASKNYVDYSFKLMETARQNGNAAFDLFNELLAAKSYSEILEKSSAYSRAQFQRFVVQSKELSEEAQKICTEAMVAPIWRGSNSTEEVS